ncbi:hypothetical protein SDC9_177005 [bioreactor metagenome]|uniref:Uncharacterized protein n=1 Tax=bioreactor metagenome TaxID=1076179 RepID=A0A645GU89_9ZZZZ
MRKTSAMVVMTVTEDHSIDIIQIHTHTFSIMHKNIGLPGIKQQIDVFMFNQQRQTVLSLYSPPHCPVFGQYMNSHLP